MKALVTGATGCLGRNLTDRLVKRGVAVVATGRNQSAGAELKSLGAAFIESDIADADRMISAAKGCDVVFHCAALASPWGKFEDFRKANVIGTKTAIQAALSAGAKMVHVSTPSIYFDFRNRLDIDEYDPLPVHQVNHYSATKLEAETLVDKAVAQDGLVAVTLRPRAIFGPHDTALFPRVLAASRNGRVPLVGRGETLIDVSCVSNVVDAMELAAERAETVSGRKYNITNGKPVLLCDLIALAFSALDMPFTPRRIPYPAAAALATAMEAWAAGPFGGAEPKLTRYSVGVLKYHQTLSIRRAEADLGYVPRQSTLAGVAEYATWRTANEAA